MNPELPADLFTSCLSTPIKVALRWLVYLSLYNKTYMYKKLFAKVVNLDYNKGVLSCGHPANYTYMACNHSYFFDTANKIKII